MLGKSTKSDDLKEQFLHVYEKYRNLMFKIADNVLHDNQLAEDAVQEAFLSISRQLINMKNWSDLQIKNYVAVAAKNSACKIRKKYQDIDIILSGDAELKEYSSDALEKMYKRVDYGRLWELVNDMKPSYASVILLKYYYRLSDAEIAEKTNTSVSNVRIRIYRAKKLLKKILSENSEYD